MPGSPSPSVPPDVPPRLRLAVARLARQLRQQDEGDLTPSQLSALSTIERLGTVTLGELAAAEHVKPPTMTKIVAALEEAGLVDRTSEPPDRRVVRVSVSEAGRRHVARSRTRRNAYLAERLRRFSHAEVEALAAALPALERLVEEREVARK